MTERMFRIADVSVKGRPKFVVYELGATAGGLPYWSQVAQFKVRYLAVCFATENGKLVP